MGPPERGFDGRDDGLRAFAEPAGGGDHGDDDAAAEQGGDERDQEQCVSLPERMIGRRSSAI